MKKSIIVFVTVLISFLFVNDALGQNRQKYRADKLYNSLAYFEAIEKYEYVVKKDTSDKQSLTRLADCYRMVNDMKNALRVYERMISKEWADPIHKYHYAQALMNSGQYDKAIGFMERHAKELAALKFPPKKSNQSDFFADSLLYSVKRLPINSELHDFSPRIFINNELVFASSRKRAQWIKRDHTWTGRSFYELYSSKKKVDGKFTKPTRFAKKITTKFNNGPVAFNLADTSMMVTTNFTRNGKIIKDKDDKVRLILLEYKWDHKKKKWINEQFFPFNSEEYNIAHPAYSADGQYLIFASDMPGGFGGMDLWISSKSNEGWNKPINLGNTINTQGNEVFPELLKNQLFFSSDALDGLGGLDIFQVELNMDYKPVQKPYNLGYPINSGADDFGITFHHVKERGYFTSNRDNLNENDDIFEFIQIEKPVYELLIVGVCIDSLSRQPLPGALVYLKDSSHNIVASLTADSSGAYTFKAEFDTDYILTAEKEQYYPGQTLVSPVKEVEENVVIKTLIELNKDPEAVLIVTIKDQRTLEILPGSTVKLVNEMTEEEFEFETNQDGEFSLALTDAKLGDQFRFAIDIKKEMYFSNSVVLLFKVEGPGEIRLIEYLTRIEVGVDLANIIEINPIYFDLDKYNIRPDAADELEKIVALMQEYPQMVVELGSHTDCRASKSYNVRLSDNRAKSSAKYIVERGIEKDRIYGKGYGETMLVNECECEGTYIVPCSEEQHQANRRTEFVIVKIN